MRLQTLTTTRLAGGIATLLFCAAIALTVATRDLWPSNDGLNAALLLLFAAMGLVIVRSQPRNAVGWLMIAVALPSLLSIDVRLYTVLDHRIHDGRLPLGQAALVFIGGWSLFPILVGLTAILLFPDGRVPSARWRRALWVETSLLGAVERAVEPAHLSLWIRQ
jgi:two-component system, NarL family, sensor kinase